MPLGELICQACECSIEDASVVARYYLQETVKPAQVVWRDDTVREIVGYLTVLPAQLACLGLYLPELDKLLRGESFVQRPFDYIDSSNDSRESQIRSMLKNSEATNVWLVSDRVVDIKIGRELKIGTVAVTWGHDDEWNLALQSPDYIISDMHGAIEFISTQMMDLPQR